MFPCAPAESDALCVVCDPRQLPLPQRAAARAADTAKSSSDAAARAACGSESGVRQTDTRGTGTAHWAQRAVELRIGLKMIIDHTFAVPLRCGPPVDFSGSWHVRQFDSRLELLLKLRENTVLE
jgi:hypothetical protein